MKKNKHSMVYAVALIEFMVLLCVFRWTGVYNKDTTRHDSVDENVSDVQVNYGVVAESDEVVGNESNDDMYRFLKMSCNVDYLLDLHGAFIISCLSKNGDNYKQYVYKDGVAILAEDGHNAVATLNMKIETTPNNGSYDYELLFGIGSDTWDRIYSSYWEQLRIFKDYYEVTSYIHDGNALIVWAVDNISGNEITYYFKKNILWSVVTKDSDGNTIKTYSIDPLTNDEENPNQCLSLPEVTDIFDNVFVNNTVEVIITEVDGEDSYDYNYDIADGVDYRVYTKNENMVLKNEEGKQLVSWVVGIDNHLTYVVE